MLLAIASGLTVSICLYWVARFTNTPKWILYTVAVIGLASMNYSQPGMAEDLLMFVKVVGGSIVLGIALGLYVRRAAMQPKAPESAVEGSAAVSVGAPSDWQSMSPAKRLGVVLVVFALVGTFAGFGITVLNPSDPGTGNNLGGALIGMLLWPYLLARLLKWKRPWSYAIFGLLAFSLISFASGYLRGLERREGLQTMEQQLLAALERFEPKSAALARTAGADQAAMQRVLLPALGRAIQMASDAAVVGLLDGTINMIDTKSGINIPRCVSALMGTAAPNSTQAEAEATAMPTMYIFDSAARNRKAPPSVDVAKAELLLGQVHARADPAGVLQDGTLLAALPDADKCDLYLRYLREIRALPLSDAGLVVRYNAMPPG